MYKVHANEEPLSTQLWYHQGIGVYKYLSHSLYMLAEMMFCCWSAYILVWAVLTIGTEGVEVYGTTSSNVTRNGLSIDGSKDARIWAVCVSRTAIVTLIEMLCMWLLSLLTSMSKVNLQTPRSYHDWYHESGITTPLRYDIYICQHPPHTRQMTKLTKGSIDSTIPPIISNNPSSCNSSSEIFFLSTKFFNFNNSIFSWSLSNPWHR